LALLDSGAVSAYASANRLGSSFNASAKFAALSLRGEANYHLKKYKESVEDYTKAAAVNSYEYSDIEFKRGVSRYYYGDKKAALKDFEAAKKRIQKYLNDIKNSERVRKYPLFTEKDLERVDLWIAKVKKEI
jgi:tetratricopeptide (TPR) repeat protein